MPFTSFRVPKSIFRSYDIRGTVPQDMDESTAYAIAKAFVAFNPSKTVAVGYDHRASSAKLRDALIEGLLDAGVTVWDLGMGMTDVSYFASWFYQPDVDGVIMVTASHLPAHYNGFKFITKQLQPIGQGSGMEELYVLAQQVKPGLEAAQRGQVIKRDVTQDYLNFVWGFVDFAKVRPLKVVIDCGNGVAGPMARRVFEPLKLDITELCFTPDATFPNHEANPIEPKNRKDIEAKVVEIGADVGIAFDADADRAYLIDEKGQFVHGDFLTALLAKKFLADHPKSAIVYDVRASLVVRDTVLALGGKPCMERVGHAHIKRRMRQEQAVFGGEVSGHYYFADNKYMDNGMIPALIALELLSQSGQPLSQLITDLGPYFVSGEINSQVKDQQAVLAALQERYQDATITRLDGVSIDYPDWRCNVRPSANEPVLRLNLEAKSRGLMEQKRDEVLALIRQG